MKPQLSLEKFRYGLIYCLLLMFFILFSGCVKTEEKISNNYLLNNRSSKSWTNYSSLINGVEQNTRACMKKNIWTFYQDGRLTIGPGLIRCNLVQETLTYDYFFGSKDNSFVFLDIDTGLSTDKTTQLFKFEITKLTDSTMELTGNFISPDGTSSYQWKLYFNAEE